LQLQVNVGLNEYARMFSFMLRLLLAASVSALAGDFAVSDHCDGETFHNLQANHQLSVGERLKLQTYMTAAWDDVEQPILNLNFAPPPAGKIKYVKIGQSTVLIQTSSMNILTDPVWAGRAGSNTFSGPIRSRPPAVRFEDLPSIDVVLISHNHFDHLDLPTLHSLHAKFDPVFIVGLGLKSFLAENGIANSVELDWWQSYKFEGAQINFVPARHTSGRGFHDRSKSLWGGFVVKVDHESIYFAGDSGYGEHFKEIAKRLGSPTLSFLPIGGYFPHWYLKDSNMSPREAVLAHLDLGSKSSEAIHYETFKTSHEDFDEPVRALKSAIQQAQQSSVAFRATSFGENVVVGDGTSFKTGNHQQ
jgi:L-ascorbate metabolism protein UlaG (beta-lactamase superfamily)